MNVPNTYVRYDTSTGKYFVLSNLNGEEIMVYNERAKVGDTMFHVRNTVDTVQRIEYSWIQDDIRKKTTTNGDIYYSGIGSEARVLWDNHLITFPEYQAGNICYGESEIIKYHFPFYFENKQSCDITSSIQNASINTISFFPNPVQTSLNFNTSDKKEFKIRNSLGVLVLEGECEEKIDLATLPKGIYFLYIQTKEIVAQTKCVKE